MQSLGLITFVNQPPTDLTTIGARIAWARQQRGMSQFELARAVGVSQGTIGNAESGARGRPRALLAIARALGASIDWLEEGRGSWEDARTDFRLGGRGGNVVGVPVKGASYFLEGDVEIDKDPASEGVVLGSGVIDGYAVKVKGDRNAPALKDGQFAVFEDGDPPPGDVGLFFLRDGTTLLRELLRETNDTYHVDSPAWGARQTLPKADVRDVHHLVAVVSPTRWRKSLA